MIYFATLRSTAQFSSVKKNLQERGLEILKYYPKLKVLKIESQKKLKLIEFPDFVTVEEEKTDFSV